MELLFGWIVELFLNVSAIDMSKGGLLYNLWHPNGL